MPPLQTITLGTNLGEVTDTHPFSVGDFIAVEDASTSPAIASPTSYLLAPLARKSPLATGRTQSATDVDASSASADYTYAYSGPQAIVKRCVKIAATGQAIVVEEIQVVGG